MPELRYPKNQLLDLFKAQHSSDGGLKDGLPSLYMPGWEPSIANGATSAGWGRTEHARDHAPGSDICWDRDGSIEPLGLTEMDDEEREVHHCHIRHEDSPATDITRRSSQRP